MSNLTPKPIVDKNGKQTTVRINPNKGVAASARKLPNPAAKKPSAPRRPGGMGGFELRGYKELTGRETANFEATIYRDGKPIIAVSNDGNGGSNRYYPAHSKVYKNEYNTNPNFKQDLKDFHDYAATVHTQYDFEQEDLLIGTMKFLSDVEKLADRAKYPREEVLRNSIEDDRKNIEAMGEQYAYMLMGDDEVNALIEASKVE